MGNCIFVVLYSNTDVNNNILSKVFVRENLSCIIGIELTYFSAGIYPDVCNHCGTKQNLTSMSGFGLPQKRRSHPTKEKSSHGK